MKKLEAVIFDMDGVLFDTERMSCECCFEAASSWDLRWRRKQSMAAADEMKRHFADILWRRRSPGIRMEPFLMKNIGNGLWRCFRRVWNGSFQLKRV